MIGTVLSVAAAMGGTVLNVAAILIGGVIGLSRRKPLPQGVELRLKVALAAFTVFYGLRLTWLSLNGSLAQILKQLLIAVLALTMGRMTGRLLGLQDMSNRLGQAARGRITEAGLAGQRRPGEGFKACTTLFCAAPLSVLGAVQDGLSGYWYPLAVKAVMDGLAAMGFAGLFRWGVLLAALPVLALQGTITLACAQWLKPLLASHGLIDSVNATGGLLVFCVALVILGLKKIALADYLPSLIFAPLLTCVAR